MRWCEAGDGTNVVLSCTGSWALSTFHRAKHITHSISSCKDRRIEWGVRYINDIMLVFGSHMAHHFAYKQAKIPILIIQSTIFSSLSFSPCRIPTSQSPLSLSPLLLQISTASQPLAHHQTSLRLHLICHLLNLKNLDFISLVDKWCMISTARFPISFFFNKILIFFQLLSDSSLNSFRGLIKSVQLITPNSLTFTISHVIAYAF